jgi:hypothetical protein
MDEDKILSFFIYAVWLFASALIVLCFVITVLGIAALIKLLF